MNYQWEPLAAVFAAPNWLDLLSEHHAEIGGLKPDPDYDRAYHLEKEGIYRAWTAREDGLLVGYIGWHIYAPLHYRSTLHAIDDLFLLSAPYRKGLAGYLMFARCLPELQHLGVKRAVVQNVVAWDRRRADAGLPGMDVLFKRLGFWHADNLWIREL